MKKLVVMSLSFIFVLTLVPTFSAATNNYDEFSFNIKGYSNSRDNGRLRDDEDNSTPWSVFVSSSTECSTCKTRFWLEDYSGTNISSSTEVAPNQRHSQKPYNKASKKYNYLTAEDNDASPSNFTVKGNWDEEWAG